MHPLIECFLAAHRHSCTQGSMFIVDKELEQIAGRFHHNAEIEAARRLRGRKKNAEVAERILNDIVKNLLTQALLSTDLNTEVYALLMEAVKRWISIEPACCHLQKTLLDLLPAVQQKQQLQKMMEKYQQHLTMRIEKNLKSDHPQPYLSCIRSQTAWFGAPSLTSRSLVRPFNDGRQPIARLIADFDKYPVDPNVALAGALTKYQAVTTLIATLKTPIKSADRQVKDFRREFAIQRPLLEKDRDSVTLKFVKGIATVLSIGLAAVFGIWKVRGKAASRQIQHILETSIKQPLQIEPIRQI